MMERRLTTDQRQSIRVALIDAGFCRSSCTMDDGTGHYSETFILGENVVSILWGPKVPLADELEQASNIVASHDLTPTPKSHKYTYSWTEEANSAVGAAFHVPEHRGDYRNG
jgi:hypothetical protein